MQRVELAAQTQLQVLVPGNRKNATLDVTIPHPEMGLGACSFSPCGLLQQFRRKPYLHPNARF